MLNAISEAFTTIIDWIRITFNQLKDQLGPSEWKIYGLCIALIKIIFSSKRRKK